jgi:hypothetical protein
MDRKGLTVCTPQPTPDLQRRPFTALTSGYIQRALPMLPGQGDRHPWLLRQNYAADFAATTFGRIDTGLTFTRNDRAARA